MVAAPEYVEHSPSRSLRFGQRFRNSLPTVRAAILGSVLWGMVMALSALTALLIRGWQTSAQIGDVAAFFAAGGLVAFVPSSILAQLIDRSQRSDTAFGTFFLCLAVLTVGATGLLLALGYRIYFAQWHGDAFTREWILHLVFTVAAGLYQFAVFGLRLYLPIGLFALFAFSLWHARMQR